MKEKKQINIDIGTRIKAAREAAGLTQERFAELVQMGPKNVSAIERGVVGISLTAVQKNCSALSISSDALFFDHCETNERVQILASRLSRLSPSQFEIVESIDNKLLEAFQLNDKDWKTT